MNRRDFIKHFTLTAAGSFLPVPWIHHQTLLASEQNLNPEHFFVFIRMEGGWDVTLSLDPKSHQNDKGETLTSESDIFLEYRQDQLLKTQHGTLGPLLEPLKPHFSDFSIVNGIFMNNTDNGHPSSLSYISSGEGSGKSPSLPVEIATSVKNRSSSPHVVFKGNLSTLNRKATLVHFDSIARTLEDFDPSTLKNLLENLLPPGESSEIIQNLFEKNQQTMRLKNELLKYKDHLSPSENTLKNAAILASSFLSGYSSSALLDLDHDLDSHSNHEKRHWQEQQAGWEKVSELFNFFKKIPFGQSGESLFSKTTFVVVSEFSRTPFLNPARGKDHNPLTNSVLFAGRNIKGGQILGASRVIAQRKSKIGFSSHVALPIDFITGEVAHSRKQAEEERFQYITPTHIAATLARAFDVDERQFRSVDLQHTPILKPLLI